MIRQSCWELAMMIVFHDPRYIGSDFSSIIFKITRQWRSSWWDIGLLPQIMALWNGWFWRVLFISCGEKELSGPGGTCCWEIDIQTHADARKQFDCCIHHVMTHVIESHISCHDVTSMWKKPFLPNWIPGTLTLDFQTFPKWATTFIPWELAE